MVYEQQDIAARIGDAIFRELRKEILPVDRGFKDADVGNAIETHVEIKLGLPVDSDNPHEMTVGGSLKYLVDEINRARNTERLIPVSEVKVQEAIDVAMEKVVGKSQSQSAEAGGDKKKEADLLAGLGINQNTTGRTP
jgi:hypothetical protein